MYSSTIHSDVDILRSVGADEDGAVVLFLDGMSLAPLDGQVPSPFETISGPVDDLADLFAVDARPAVRKALERGRSIACRTEDLRLAGGASASLHVFRLRERPELVAAVIAPEVAPPGMPSVTEALDLSVEQFRLLAGALPMGVFIWEQMGALTFANQVGLELMGISSLDEPWHEAFHPDDWPAVEQAVLDLPRTRGIDVEARLVHDGCDVSWCRVVARDVRTVDGELLSVIGLIEDITEQHAARTALQVAATRDPLTGLPNRTSLVEHLEELLDQPATNLAVLFVDLDGFKHVNDTMGHSIGDRLLSVVAERFTDATRPEDMVARFGGDEFVIVARARSSASPQLAADRIHAALASPVPLGNRLVDVTASIGIATRDDGASSPDQLLGDADLAMYAAKHAGRNRTVVYNSTLRHAAAQRFDIIGDLRHAVDREQTRLFYQPIVNLTTDAAVGAESLIRWQHPSYGRLLPNAFIRLAEENGLINGLGDWVLRQACRDLAELRASDVVGQDFFVSVNVSMMQLSTVNDLISTAERAIDEHGLHPSNLLFELTESLPLDAIPRASEQIRELNDRGFRLAVDDFGTGYSSLEYLTLLPYDVLKIDPSFTSRLDAPDAYGAAEAVLESLVHLSHRLSFDLICEGIETRRQLTQVIGTSVQFGQGYLFAQPCPLDELKVHLRGAGSAIDLTASHALGTIED